MWYSNKCVLFQDIDNVGTWSGEAGPPNHMIVNTEWGAFGDQGELDFIKTKWDTAGSTLYVSEAWILSSEPKLFFSLV